MKPARNQAMESSGMPSPHHVRTKCLSVASLDSALHFPRPHLALRLYHAVDNGKQACPSKYYSRVMSIFKLTISSRESLYSAHSVCRDRTIKTTNPN